MSTTPLDILIAGAGPTGLTLAIDLARRGLRVRIIEKDQECFTGSRAKGVQPRTLEVLHDLDALGPVLNAGTTYPPMGLHVGRFTIPWQMIPAREATVDSPYPSTWLIPQYDTNAILYRRLEQFGVSVEFNSKLESFEQSNDVVEAVVAREEGIEHIECGFLVGADGAASAVRRQSGINFVGKTDETDRIMIVDSRVEELSRDYWHIWPGLRGRFIGACPLPDRELFQWMIRLRPDEVPNFEEEALNDRIRRHTKIQGLRLYDIQWTSVFRPNIRLAEQYRKGRVFIAGDAAHVHTPAGAQGLNTGIQDAYNLGWKLAQVISGAPAGLLDTYEAERHPVAAAVLRMSTKKYKGTGTLAPSSYRRGKDTTQLLITYRGGPLANMDAESTLTLNVGDRAPDAILLSAGGGPVRMFDVYRGPHFSAVAYGHTAAKALSELEWPSGGAPLKRVAINAGHDAGTDFVLSDAACAFQQIYGVTADTLLLVRPDGYIAHIATRDMLTTTRTAARTMTRAQKIPDAPHIEMSIG